MSFKFDFQLVSRWKEGICIADEKNEDEEIDQDTKAPTFLSEATTSSKPSYKITLDELVSPRDYSFHLLEAVLIPARFPTSNNILYSVLPSFPLRAATTP